MDGGPSGRADQISQLVERAESLGAGAGDRSGRIARVVDGEFSVDPFGQDRDAKGTKADDRSRSCASTGSEIFARVLEGWELGWPLPARRCRNDESLAGRRERNAGVARTRLGLVICNKKTPNVQRRVRRAHGESVLWRIGIKKE